MTTLSLIRITVVAVLALSALTVATTAMLMIAAQSATLTHAAETVPGNYTYETVSSFAPHQITAQTAEYGVFDPAVNSES